MQSNQTLSSLSARILTAIDDVIVNERPDVVLIQGDTTTVAAVAMAAFHRHVMVGHVEAGLRSGDLQSPFPEEMNRRVCSLLTTLHFAPTERAATGSAGRSDSGRPCFRHRQHGHRRIAPGA